MFKQYKEHFLIIEDIVSICKKLNATCYIVGGAVRDALLKREVNDFDLSVSISPKNILNLLADKYKTEFNERFNTSRISFEDITIDLNLMRKEEYLNNGALPIVSKGSLFEDLYRRDFTINAMAYDLINNEPIDYFNGREDLQNGILKSVHDNSYIEDPTRIFRGARYASRYGFEIDQSEKLLIRRLCSRDNVLDIISNERYSTEILKILDEETYKNSLDILQEVNVVRFNTNYQEIKFDRLSKLDNRVISYYIRTNDKRLLESSSLRKNIKKLLNTYESLKTSLACINDNYEIFKLLKNAPVEVIELLSNDKIYKYKIHLFENYLKGISINYKDTDIPVKRQNMIYYNILLKEGE